jgi:hypothetical protein
MPQNALQFIMNATTTLENELNIPSSGVRLLNILSLVEDAGKIILSDNQCEKLEQLLRLAYASGEYATASFALCLATYLNSCKVALHY